MLGYSKFEWIVAGILGVVLFSWILWPAEKKPTEPKTKKASSSEIMKCSELINESPRVL